MIEVLLTTDTLEAKVPPSETVAPDRKPVPVIVIDVPPAVDPTAGETEVTVGAAGVGEGDGEGEGDGVGVGVGVGAPPHGSTAPCPIHPLFQRYHWESVPNT